MSIPGGSRGGGHQELSITPLPPLPKLRLKPGLSKPLSKPRPPVVQDEEEAADIGREKKTSRLLMKSECRSAGGRRKNGSSSLVHSIPKFSEVKGGQLSEVQKVLQSRLLSRQRLKQQQQLQQQQIQQLQDKATLHSYPPKARRGRKPDKRAITHVLKGPPPILPHLTEVTITPKVIALPQCSVHREDVGVEEEEKALDLRTKNTSLNNEHPSQHTKMTSALADINNERTIRKLKYSHEESPGECSVRRRKRYILDPDRKSNVFMSGDFAPILRHSANE
eukprot:TRINITY_DN6238_c0_g1_i1.p1 TRINITY_DN6238_c0_g1~~TRINITY_DN6238_c0_g1_i1.p1  ORF type:complete len:279 (+),score=89.67 TRINITY_DN6238_c0_g1_i1:167-1003(+)